MVEKPETEQEVMTLEEAAVFLRIHVRTLYVLAQKGKVPVQKVGNRWRFSRTGLIDWMSKGR